MNQNKTFFGGDPAFLFKRVSTLPCKNFKEFFDTQIWEPIRLKFTRAEYEALPPAEQKATKFVRYFTPAAFAQPDEKGGYLKQDSNVSSINLVCLDIDPEIDRNTKEEISFPAAPLIDNPSLIWEALDGLSFFVYTTLNHRKDRPRIRIVVDADSLTPASYAQAVNLIASLLGLPFVTKESKVPSQAMFRPTVFADTDLESEHIVIASNLKGAPLTQDTVDSYEGGDSKQPVRGHTGRLDTNGMLDGLEYLKPPAQGVTLEEVEGPLFSISPNCSMFDWIRCAMALRHQFPDQDDEAFEMFNRWSAEGESYEGEEKARYRWDHTSATTTTRLPTTVRTLFKIAKEGGWSNPSLAQKYFQDLKEWLETRETLEELVDQGMRRIITTPLLSSIYEESLLNIIKKRAKKQGMDFTVAKLTKELKKLKADIRDKQRKQEEEEKGAPLWARGLVYVSKLELFYKANTSEVVSRSSFDSSFGVNLLPSPRELEERGDTSRQGKFTPSIRPQDYVLNELEIPRVYDQAYDPANPDDIISVKGGIRYANTYRKSYAKPDPKKAKEAGDVIKGHVALLIPEEEHQTRLIDFIAYMVQHPGKKIRWAFVIQSAQGNGKSLFAKALRGVYGRGNIKTVDPEAIFSPFNEWACGSVLSILNEIRVTGHSRHDVMNKLKEPIADDHVSVNQKFRDNREVDNVTNYLMFTNHKDALALEERERRYFVVFSQLQTERDTQALVDSGKLKPLQDLVDSQEFGGLRSFFEEWEISPDFCPDSPPPKTESFYQMANLAKPDVERAVLDLLEDTQNPFIQDDIVSSTALMNLVNAELKQPTSAKAVSSALLQKGFNHIGRFTVAGTRHQIWVDPDSAVADLNILKILESRITNSGDELL